MHNCHTLLLENKLNQYIWHVKPKTGFRQCKPFAAALHWVHVICMNATFCQYPVWTICHWFTLNTYDTHRHCILSVKCEPFAAGSHGMRTIQISTAFWQCQYVMDKCCDLSALASSVNHSLLYSKSASFAVVAPSTVTSRPLHLTFPSS